MRKKGNKSGWVLEYKFHVPLADRSTVSDIFFQCYWYRKRRGVLEYSFDHADPTIFYCVDTIISPATMTLVTPPDMYKLDCEANNCMLSALRGYTILVGQSILE